MHASATVLPAPILLEVWNRWEGKVAAPLSRCCFVISRYISTAERMYSRMLKATPVVKSIWSLESQRSHGVSLRTYTVLQCLLSQSELLILAKTHCVPRPDLPTASRPRIQFRPAHAQQRRMSKGVPQHILLLACSLPPLFCQWAPLSGLRMSIQGFHKFYKWSPIMSYPCFRPHFSRKHPSFTQAAQV